MKPEKPEAQEKCGKQLDAVKLLKNHIVWFINTENLLRRDLQEAMWKNSYWGFLGRQKMNSKAKIK